jgi:Uma2 family endonuclease
VLSPASSVVDIEGGEKYRLYARRGVAEYWVVAPKTSHIDAYSDPDADDEAYRSHRAADRQMSALTLPDFSVE